MTKIDRVSAVEVENLNGWFVVAAVGEVTSTGWTRGRLVPRYVGTAPRHGLWEMDFEADPPYGNQFPVRVPIAAMLRADAPIWAKGVRVHAASGYVDAVVAGNKTKQVTLQLTAMSSIIRQKIAGWEDSIGPTGNSKWDPWPHAEMQKLVHELILTVDGPDSNKIRQCIEQAIAAGLIAAIIAAVGTGGGALPAAIGAFVASLEGCLGSSYSVRVDDVSHWEYWWT